jgi:hypothetical protein
MITNRVGPPVRGADFFGRESFVKLASDKLKEKLRESWQEGGEELFKRIAAANTTVVFFLDEFPMMIDRMARSEKHREDAKLMLYWLRALRVRPDLTNVRFLIAGSIGIGRVLNELGEIAAINDFESLKLDPFTPKIASDFLDALAASENIPLTQPNKRKMLEVIGTPVPYFLQIIFSEVSKAHLLDAEAITPRKPASCCAIGGCVITGWR